MTFFSISSSVMPPSGTWNTLSYAWLIPLLTPRYAASLARSSSAWVRVRVRVRVRVGVKGER